MSLPYHIATRYLVPLREGGSLPAVLDTEEGGLYVAKFRGAGQGSKALIAEIITGGIALAIGLPVPELALLELDESFGRSEPDPEIQDILTGSRGVNFGMRYMEGAYNYDPLAGLDVSPELAAEVIWLDAFTLNVDRTARNTNLMWWDNQLWLIDHGAALYFHHNWPGVTAATSGSAFPAIKDHVLLRLAGDISDADARIRSRLNDEALREIIATVPDELLMDSPEGTTPPFATASENRAAYLSVLAAQLANSQEFIRNAGQAVENAKSAEPQQIHSRR